MIYHVLLRLIQFGTYRYGDRLPTIENMAWQMLVSQDTVRSAYLRLKREGLISLTKNVGAVVQAQYSDQETDAYIQAFFGLRRDALVDLSHSVEPLLGQIQYVGLRYAAPEALDAMEQLSQEGVAASCVMLQYFRQKYAALGNEMLLRLMWQIYMFFYAPFLSTPGNLRYLGDAGSYVPNLVRLCRSGDWAELRSAAEQFQAVYSGGIRRFLEGSIPERGDGEQVSFHWDSYRKPSQRCYSLAMELLLDIHHGVYPAGSPLPTLERLAAEKGVSVSTVRRAEALLTGAGAVKGMRRAGTLVLPREQAAAHCDLTCPPIQGRLLDMAQSMQIIALSCKEVSQLTVAALSGEDRRRWRERICGVLQEREPTSGIFAGMELIVSSAPYRTIRLVYGQLLRQLFWYAAFRGGYRRADALDARCLTCLGRMAVGLEEADPALFSTALEELMLHEFQALVAHLLDLGLREAGALLIPDELGPAGGPDGSPIPGPL